MCFNLRTIRKFIDEVSELAKYMTRQRKLLLDFLSAHTDETLSAGQIAAALLDQGISTSSIYRNLAALEQNGCLKRAAKPGSQEAYYRYADEEHCQRHLHLSCLLGILISILAGTPVGSTIVAVDIVLFLLFSGFGALSGGVHT